MVSKRNGSNAGSAADVVLVFTTVGSDDQASLISEQLVQQGLAACVNVLPAIKSVYRWKGKIWRDDERLLIIKTTRDAFEPLRKALRSLHSYELPEIVAIPLAAGDSAYLDWLRDSVSADGTLPEVTSGRGVEKSGK